MISRNLFPIHRSMAFFALAALLVLPSLALAQDATELTKTTCGFFTNIKTVLNAISIVVVTVAVMFSGYKIAFAHARIGEVTPVLVGAILIGAASQIAKLFLSDTGECQATTSLIPHAIDHIAALAQTLQHLV